MVGLWLKRFAWLAAWSLWLVFGYALYVVVPRYAGPPICFLPVGEKVHWFTDSNTIVSTDNDADVVRIRSGTDGRLLRTWPLPAGDYHDLSIHQDVLVATREAEVGKELDRATALDLQTGREQPLDCLFPRTGRRFSFHAERPWALCEGWLPEDGDRINTAEATPRILVLDLRTGRTLGSLPPLPVRPGGRSKYRDPYLVPGTDFVAVDHQVQSAEHEFAASTLELWRIPFGAAPERSFPGVAIGDEPVFSMNERVAWHDRGAIPSTIDVFDLRNGRFLLSDPPRERREQPGGSSGGPAGPEISFDGATVVDTLNDRVLDVATGRVLWSLKNDSSDRPTVDDVGNIVEMSCSPEDFALVRWWNEWIAPHVGSLKITGEFRCVRDLRTGALKFLSDETTIGVNKSGVRRLRLSPNAAFESTQLFESPPHVRWVLIAVIQAIAALPMVVVLTIGWWKRQRAAGRARSAAMPPDA